MADASHASFLPPIVTFCAGAVIAAPLFRRFGLSAVLGYLAAGIVIGPFVPGMVTDAAAIRGVAEIGVVLLLFIVGFELQPSRLIAVCVKDRQAARHIAEIAPPMCASATCSGWRSRPRMASWRGPI
ncbi:MAG: hypothetical protein HEQ16_07625 [Bosea sp.]|jgi:Kef-type K+ transport system membrane component KefB|nr:hypothetical protein [Bosea sp. (in: a-proteobacteria)]